MAKLKSSLKAVQVALSKLKVGRFQEEEEEEEEAGTRFAEAEAAGEENGRRVGCDEWESIPGHSLRVRDSEIEAETDIFAAEEVYRSFNSLYIVSDVNSSTVQSVLPFQEGEFDRRKIFDGQGNLLSEEDKMDWGFNDSEAEVQSSSGISLSLWSESQFQSESSRSTDLVAEIVRELNSQRFFFSSRISNSRSILEEAKGEESLEGASPRRKGSIPHNLVVKAEVNPDLEEVKFEEANSEAGDYCAKLGPEDCEYVDERNKFEKDSVAIMMYSTDPFVDFKNSMQEMIEAHDVNIRDWSSLRDLLCCYLNLNNNSAHKFIVAAFLDLLNNASNAARVQPEA